MNHQVEHDIHVQRTRREDAEPVRFKEHGPVPERHGSGDRGIEAFQVPWLNDTVVLPCRGKYGICLVQRGCQRLFDQEVDASLKKL